MTTTVRIICFTLLLSAFSFRAAAKDSTNTSADYLLKTTNESRGNSESVGKVQDFLFLPPTTMPANYRHMADLFATRIIKRGHAVYPLPRAEKPLAVTYQSKGKTVTTDEFMSRNDVTGLLLIKDGKIVLERYGSGNTEKTKWPSWSIAKSVTSTLVGAALKDGYIASIDDPVTKYLPQLKGSAYEGTTIKNLLQMSSGIKFNENYEDRNSDFSRLMECYYDRAGAACVLSLAKAVSRQVPPGTKFQYVTLNTTVVGLVVMAATHKTLAGYLSEKIWSPFGMEEDAMWVLDSNGGQEFGGALIGATLRDYGRFGEFILNGGTAGGKQVVPKNWVDETLTVQNDSKDSQGYPYTYLWRVMNTGSFFAKGIMGQFIFVCPKKQIVIIRMGESAGNLDWPGFFQLLTDQL